MGEAVKSVTLVRDFNKVCISLENILLPDDKLSPTPSMCDGLNAVAETDLRILGCELIQTTGNLLKLPQVAMATGQVLYQRFYYSKSFVKHNYEVVAMACINLASKIEEGPRRIRDVINVVHHIKQIRNKKPAQPLLLDQNYVNLKNQVIKAERRVLKELGFCVHVKHPHKIIVMYLQVLEAERNRDLVQLSWNYMNDSFRTNVFVRFPPETIACACIYLAARKLQISLPNNPAWYLLFGAEESDIQLICHAILKLYTWHKINIDELEKLVTNLKKATLEAKLKAKERGGVNATPTIESQSATPEKGSLQSPLVRPDLRHLKSDDEKSNDSFGRNLVQHHRKRHSSRSRSNSRHKKPRSQYKNDHHSRSRSSSSHSPPPTASHKSADKVRAVAVSSSDAKYYSTSRSDTARSSRSSDFGHRDRDDGRFVDKRFSSKESRLPSRYAVESKKRSPTVTDKSRYSKYNLSPVVASRARRSNSASPDSVATVITSKKHSAIALVEIGRHKNGGHKRHSRQRSRSRSKERRNSSSITSRVKELDGRR